MSCSVNIDLQHVFGHNHKRGHWQIMQWHNAAVRINVLFSCRQFHLIIKHSSGEAHKSSLKVHNTSQGINIRSGASVPHLEQRLGRETDRQTDRQRKTERERGKGEIWRFRERLCGSIPTLDETTAPKSYVMTWSGNSDYMTVPWESLVSTMTLS